MPTVYSDAQGPFGRNLLPSAAVRTAIHEAGLSVPVVVSGGISTYEQAEEIIEKGKADIVAAARQTLADPDWFRKLKTGYGDEVRRCEYTNYCEALDQRHKMVTCKLWDRMDMGEAGLNTTPDGKRRLIAPKWTKSSH